VTVGSVTWSFHGDRMRLQDGLRTCREDVEDGHAHAEAEEERAEVTGARSLRVSGRWARVVLWMTAVETGAVLGVSPALAAGVPVQHPGWGRATRIRARWGACARSRS
jgi:hypothetical protein